MIRRLLHATVVASAVAAVPIAASFQAPARSTPAAAAASTIDGIFARFGRTTPGCAVSVSSLGRSVYLKAFGMADLEHDVAMTPRTIFEAGSVSKQFTAEAMMRLERDGKLSLDDQVRKYVPELPDYGEPMTIRQMLNHTSGLRDWGSVEGIAGWPRTRRAYTQAHVLDILSRQSALNFSPGTHWSYSNSGFNLAAMIVARVGGKSFPEFTRQRLFEPLGMVSTSWRDDFTAVIKGRAIAYAGSSEFHTDMPFENAYGNGGLLTTVGDLQKWNEHLQTPPAADAAMVAEQQRPGRFNDGRPHGYGLGLFLGTHNGVREVYHSGSTAGYQAYLTRFPDQHLSVAVLCNLSTAEPTRYAHEVADIFLGASAKRQSASSPAQVSDAHGFYRSTLTGLALTMGADPDGRKWTFTPRGAIAVDEFGTTETYDREQQWLPSPALLTAFAGTYASDDAEAQLTAVVEGGELHLKRRPDTTLVLTPLYADAFKAGSLGTVIFRRDAAGLVTAFSVVQDRVWDLRFTRLPPRS